MTILGLEFEPEAKLHPTPPSQPFTFLLLCRAYGRRCAESKNRLERAPREGGGIREFVTSSGKFITYSLPRRGKPRTQQVSGRVGTLLRSKQPTHTKPFFVEKNFAPYAQKQHKNSKTIQSGVWCYFVVAVFRLAKKVRVKVPIKL